LLHLLKFVLNRLLAAIITLFLITLILYGLVMLTPPETRATLYFPNTNRPMTEEQVKRLIEKIIQDRHLRDPFPVQYAIWAGELVRGNWGYSPALHEAVLPVMLRRSPVTAELTIYSLLVFIPLGIISGMIAGSKKDRGVDHGFRLTAFIASSMPPFIMALVLLSIFYVTLKWFPPERLSIQNGLFVKSAEFQTYTGLMTLDGFLNGRPDISLDALRHLVLPVITLSLVHWAMLGRVTRALTIEELEKEYIVAGKARGLSNYSLLWTHTFRNIMAPSLASSALSAAALFTGVFVVEVIFNFKGISEIAVNSINQTPDAPAVLGFAIYSVLVVLTIMLVLDIIQAIVDPRLREGFQTK
jgi:ABC-type dipeptide/oligopeptide/nickel transport system permease component